MFRKIRESLNMKIALPVFIVILLLLSALGGFIYRNQVQQITQDTESKVDAGLEKVMSLYNEAQENEKDVLRLNNQYALGITHMLARNIKKNPQILTNGGLEDIKKDIEVIEEIHIVNEDGKIAYGTNQEFYGYDFAESEQTRPFLEGINNRDFELAQEPQQRGTDGTLFQYIGVSRLDEPGVIQIGINPSIYAEIVQRNSIDKLIERNSFGLVEPWVVNQKGDIVTHKDDSYLGKNLKDMGIYDKVIGKQKGEFEYITENGDKRIFSFVKHKNHYLGVTGDLTTALAPARENIRFFSLIGLIGLVVTMLVVYYIVRFLVGEPVAKLAEETGYVADGDLTREIEVKSRDEIGHLTRNFNNMSNSLRQLVDQVQGVSERVFDNSQQLADITVENSETSQQLASTIEELAAMASNQSSDTQRGSDSIEKMADSMKVIITQTREVSDKVDKTRKLTEAGEHVAEDQIEKMTDNKKSTMEVGKIIDTLSNQAGDIVHILDTIKSISEQTNLLALNAAIEAARAGEHGRGFSVVAEEIRGLAEETGRATNQVAKIIEEINGNIGSAVTEMEVAEDALEAQEQAVDNTVTFFNKINNFIQEMTGSVNQIVQQNDKNAENIDIIVEMIQNLSASSEETAASTEEASAATEEQTSSLEQISDSADKLANLSNKLKDMVQQFKV